MLTGNPRANLPPGWNRLSCATRASWSTSTSGLPGAVLATGASRRCQLSSRITKKRGVDFVYITDNSSSTDGFLELKQKHSGDHFLFTKEDIKAMNIPSYSGSIPHYLIYGRDGHLIKAITGWDGLESMTQELDKALAQ